LFFLGIAAASLGTLASFAPRTRSRSEWLSCFDSWAGPASETEDKKVATADRMVRETLSRSKHLSGYKLRFIPQGSSINNTNVKQYSDLDLVVVHDQPWYRPAPGEKWPTGFTPGGLSLVDEHRKFRASVFQALQDAFFDGSVKETNKCIKVASTATTRVACDVVPSFVYRQFQPLHNALSIATYHEGIIFVTSKGDEIDNYPEQHLANGRNKNLRTGYRYKQIVRVLKKMKVIFKDEQTLLAIVDFPSSYEIETLAFNVPDSLMTAGDLFDGVVASLKWIELALSGANNCNKLVRISGFNNLFPYWAQSATLLSVGSPSASPEVIHCRNFAQRALRALPNAC
jgi:hypothetical protein